MDYANVVKNLGALYHLQMRYEESSVCYSTALPVLKSLLGKYHADVGLTINDLAVLESSRGNDDSAEVLYKEAIEIHEIVFGTSHPDYALAMTNLANFYVQLGDHEKAAKELLIKAIAIYQERGESTIEEELKEQLDVLDE